VIIVTFSKFWVKEKPDGLEEIAKNGSAIRLTLQFQHALLFDIAFTLLFFTLLLRLPGSNHLQNGDFFDELPYSGIFSQ
jgi:hypothetical protein